MLRRMLATLVISAAALVGQGNAVAADQTTQPPLYYYQVTDIDGATQIETMSTEESLIRRRELTDRFKQANIDHEKLKKQWQAVAGQQAFPVPEPKSPVLIQKTIVPGNAAQQQAMETRLNAPLEVYTVYIIAGADGKREVEMARGDQILSKKRAVGIAYVEAVIEVAQKYAEDKKTDPKAKKPEMPKREEISVVKTDLRKEAAEKLVKTGNERLAEEAKKQAEKDAEAAKKKETEAARKAKPGQTTEPAATDPAPPEKLADPPPDDNS